MQPEKKDYDVPGVVIDLNTGQTEAETCYIYIKFTNTNSWVGLNLNFIVKACYKKMNKYKFSTNVMRRNWVCFDTETIITL